MMMSGKKLIWMCETDWDQIRGRTLKRRLHGKQHKIDKNKNGRIDIQRLQNVKKKTYEGK